MPVDRYRYFRAEARELIDQLGKGVLELEKAPSPRQVAGLLRFAHTLKGAARVVKQRGIADDAHAIEDVLAPFRDGATAVPRDRIDAILKLLDAIDAKLAAIDAPGTPGSAPAPTGGPIEPARAPSPDDRPRIVRAELEEIDALIEGVSEVGIQLTAVRRTFSGVERARRLAELLDEQLGSARAQRQLDGAGPKVRSIAAELRAMAEQIDRSLTTGVDAVERELKQVREAAERMRLFRANGMFGDLERTARDAAHSAGKRVTFVATGGAVRLDADVLTAVQAALVQAIRNAIAHGIEPEAERVGRRKPPHGLIEIAITRRDGRVAFACRDDGRGVDLEAVRAVARRNGVGPTQIQELGASQLLELLLGGGISTAGSVTELAGRGVGLDVIRDTATRLGGEVRVTTNAGIGTTFELIVPVSLTSLDALTFQAGGQTASIPLDAVTRTLRLTEPEINHTADGATIVVAGGVIPFFPLERALRRDITSPSGERRAWSAIIVSASSGAAAIGVDCLIGVENIVVRPLPPDMAIDPVIGGCSLDVAGNPQLVLDPTGLIELGRRNQAFVPRSPRVRSPVLVIDDSLTTRMLEQSILESAGYEVDLATSAEEGLERARNRRYALFLVDVEMPGMDGFEFIARTRADPALRDTPAVLVTSRNSAEDRQKAHQVGAAGHVVKSEFDQHDLLARIRALIGAQ
ncbi:MAG: response regulator [Kofleriaceae bacterium]